MKLSYYKNNLLAELINARWDTLKDQGCRYLLERIETIVGKHVMCVFGGAVRDWYLKKEPKDIDIVVHTERFNDIVKGLDKKSNTYGGNVITLSGVVFDIWNLDNTLAIKSGQFSPTWNDLTRSVP